MSPLGLLTGYAVLGLAFLLVSPLIFVIAVVDWLTFWRKGRAPSPFLPEHPASAKEWAETMERGRQLQEKEEP